MSSSFSSNDNDDDVDENSSWMSTDDECEEDECRFSRAVLGRDSCSRHWFRIGESLSAPPASLRSSVDEFSAEDAMVSRWRSRQSIIVPLSNTSPFKE